MNALDFCLHLSPEVLATLANLAVASGHEEAAHIAARAMLAGGRLPAEDDPDYHKRAEAARIACLSPERAVRLAAVDALDAIGGQGMLLTTNQSGMVAVTAANERLALQMVASTLGEEWPKDWDEGQIERLGEIAAAARKYKLDGPEIEGMREDQNELIGVFDHMRLTGQRLTWELADIAASMLGCHPISLAA